MTKFHMPLPMIYADEAKTLGLEAIPYYTADQMQTAWQAGRDSMKAECVKVCEGMKTVSGVDDCERGFNAALRRSAESIKELK